MENALVFIALAKENSGWQECFKVLSTILRNLIDNPYEEKYRKIRTENPKLKEVVFSIESSRLLLEAAGWTEVDAEFLYKKEQTSDLKELKALIDAELPAGAAAVSAQSSSGAGINSEDRARRQREVQEKMHRDELEKARILQQSHGDQAYTHARPVQASHARTLGPFGGAGAGAGGGGSFAGGSVHHVTSEAEFLRAIKQSNLTVVDFFATWCGPCKMVAPAVEQMAGQHTNVTFLKVDVDELPSVSQGCGVRAMPTFQFYKDGKKVDEFAGADVNKLRQKISQFA